MKNNPIFTTVLTLTLLASATFGSYFLGRRLPRPEPALTPDLPTLSNLSLPVQTDGSFTAEAVSYYADASRVILRFRISQEQYNPFAIDSVDLYDTNGEFINSSLSYGPVSENDPSLYQFDFNPVIPLQNQLLGALRFRIVESSGEGEALADFSIDLDLPVDPAQIYNPQLVTNANGVELLLDRLVITAAHTQAYLCYDKPSSA